MRVDTTTADGIGVAERSRSLEAISRRYADLETKYLQERDDCKQRLEMLYTSPLVKEESSKKPAFKALLDKDIQTTKRLELHYDLLASYYGGLKRKYTWAAQHPGSAISPDPPEPK